MTARASFRFSQHVARGLLCLVLLLLSLHAIAGDRGPEVPRGKGDMCVAPTDDMRRNHMDYIMHQRDETVVEGIRGKVFSLTDCINCHAQTDDSGKALRVDAPGQFCQSCHSFAAIKIDCFSCHRATPDAPVSTAALKRMPLSHHGRMFGYRLDNAARIPTASDLDALRHMSLTDADEFRARGVAQ